MPKYIYIKWYARQEYRRGTCPRREDGHRMVTLSCPFCGWECNTPACGCNDALTTDLLQQHEDVCWSQHCWRVEGDWMLKAPVVTVGEDSGVTTVQFAFMKSAGLA